MVFFCLPTPLLTCCLALMTPNDCYDCYDYTKLLIVSVSRYLLPSTSSFSSYLFSRVKSGYPSRAYLPTSVSLCFCFCCCFFCLFSYHVSLPQFSCISFVGGYLFAGYIVRIPQPFFFSSISCPVLFFIFIFRLTLFHSYYILLCFPGVGS